MKTDEETKTVKDEAPEAEDTKDSKAKTESDKIIEEAKKKADAEKKKRIRSAEEAQLDEEQLKSISLEKRVRRYVKPDGLFRKDLSSSQLEEAKKVILKSGRKIGYDKAAKRPTAVPGWDDSINTRRPLINA